MPVILTFLAPAERCNQHCPHCYLTELVHEPVHVFDLLPADYGTYVQHFAEANIPIRAVSGQGYEVTLPQSWPYLEAAFEAARAQSVPRSFVTNGMLLAKWIDQISAIEPEGIVVSLDGADAGTNDRFRGLDGAFDATLGNLRKFLSALPAYRGRLAIASTLLGERSFRSLQRMPKLLRELGLRRWQVSYAFEVPDDRCQPVERLDTLVSWSRQLRYLAQEAGIEFDFTDEFHHLQKADRGDLPVRRLYHSDALYRLDPMGNIHSGEQLLRVFDPACARPWDPATENAVEVSRYWRRWGRPPSANESVEAGDG